MAKKKADMGAAGATESKKDKTAADRDAIEEAARAILGMATKATEVAAEVTVPTKAAGKKTAKAAAGGTVKAADEKANKEMGKAATKETMKREAKSTSEASPMAATKATAKGSAGTETKTATKAAAKVAAKATPKAADEGTAVVEVKAASKNTAKGTATMSAEKEKSRKRKPLKNSNGQGSVYKLSGRRRKPWAARITNGWTDDGKQIKQLIGYFEKKAEAEEALVMHRINPVSSKANITFGELYNEWSDTKFEMISRSTADNYRAAWIYLEKYKSVKFKELRTTHFQEVINTCLQEGKSRSTMGKIKTLSTSLYSYAMQNDIVNKNYATFIALSKPEKSKKETFTEADIKKMFANVNKVEWVDTILILCYTGMRISELLGLTRFNVDMDQQLITGGVKTDAGKDRTIPIHPKIAALVRKWYNKGGNYLICNEKGGKISVSSYRDDKYYPALEQLELKRLTPHSCRHTFGTMLSKAGANTKAIQDMIGHSDYALTANIYTHPDLDELRREIGKI